MSERDTSYPVRPRSKTVVVLELPADRPADYAAAWRTLESSALPEASPRIRVWGAIDVKRRVNQLRVRPGDEARARFVLRTHERIMREASPRLTWQEIAAQERTRGNPPSSRYRAYASSIKSNFFPGCKVVFSPNPVSRMLYSGDVPPLGTKGVWTGAYTDPSKHLLEIRFSTGQTFGVPKRDLIRAVGVFA